MANVVKVKQSSVALKVPTTAQLSLGELAVNTTDGKLYFKKNVSGTESIVELGANATVGGVSSQVQYNNAGAFAGSSNLRFDGTTLTAVKDASINGLTVGRGAGGVSSNTATGVAALFSNTTGSYNTAYGGLAIYYNTTGYNNTVSGYRALLSNTTGGSNTAIGTYAMNNNTIASYNTAIGNDALYSNTTGSSNTASGHQALYNNTMGSGNTALSPRNSADAYAPVFNPITENNRFCMGSTGVTNAYIQVAWTVVSDARDKTDFAPVPHGLDFVSKLQTTAYRYKMNRSDTEGHGPVRYGFKAQQVLELEGDTPVIVDAEDLDKLRFNDQALIAVLVNAIKELNAKFDAYVSTHP